MPASVTKYFPTMYSAGKLPFAISLRRPLTPIEPSGNAIAAATSRRSGVVGVIDSGGGITGLRIATNGRGRRPGRACGDAGAAMSTAVKLFSGAASSTRSVRLISKTSSKPLKSLSKSQHLVDGMALQGIEQTNEIGTPHRGSIVIHRRHPSHNVLMAKQKQPPGAPMTLGNMRHLGVQRLVATCLNDACRHQGLIDVSKFPDDAEEPSFASKAVCARNPPGDPMTLGNSGRGSSPGTLEVL